MSFSSIHEPLVQFIAVRIARSGSVEEIMISYRKGVAPILGDPG
jgi:hypothetical protein